MKRNILILWWIIVGLMNGAYTYYEMRQPPSASMWASVLAAVLVVILYVLLLRIAFLLGRYKASR